MKLPEKTPEPPYPEIKLTQPGESDKENPPEVVTPPQSGEQQHPQEEELVFDREIFNLNVNLIRAIEDFIAQEKRAGRTMWDEKAKKEKKINKSLWAREVFTQALKDAGYKPSPKIRRGE